MAMILEDAVEGYSEMLALFTKPDVETGIQDMNHREYCPISQVNGSSVLEFYIPNNGSDYINLKEASLQMEIEILKDDGERVSATDLVGVVNMPATTIFRQMDLNLQQTTITTSVGSNFAYKCIIDTLLESGHEQQNNILSTTGFYKDTRRLMDKLPGEANAGLDSRFDLTKAKKMTVRTPLMMDFAQIDKCILNGVAINIKLFPATDKFRLMYKDPSTTQTTSMHFTLNITKAVLSLPFIRVHPALIVAHNKMLENQPAVYPFIRSDIKAYNVASDSHSWSVENIFQDNIPKSLVIALVSSASYSGSNKLNPFNFKHYDLSYLNFEVDGISVPHQPLQPNYSTDNPNYVAAYSTLFNTRPPWQKHLPNIKYEDYMNGYTLYVLDLEGSKSQAYQKLKKKGNTRLSINFRKKLPEAAIVLCYGKFDSLVTIDSARNVFVAT